MTPDPILSACVLGLIGAVGHLWRQNSKLGERLDNLNRALGKLEGLASAVQGCHIEHCPMRTLFADWQAGDQAGIRRRRPRTAAE